MRIFISLLFLSFTLSINTFAKTSVLKKFCSDYNGKVKFGFQCPKSKIPLPINMCTFTNDFGERQFFDGCSGPTGGFKELFFPACIKHDLCYHHEPATNGFTQAYCDNMFYEMMVKSCEGNPKNQKCLKWAKILYNGVKKIGKAAYHCENIPGNY